MRANAPLSVQMQDPETNLALAHEALVSDGSTDLSLAQDLRKLADEAKTFALAEVAFQKSRAAYVGAEARTISVLLVLAAVVAFFALMAFVVGTVIALGPVLGPWGAMAVVTVVLLLIAGVCAWNARTKMKRMMSVVRN